VIEHRTVSMEESATGAVSAFLDLESCECLQSVKFLAYLAGALQRYEEEGVLIEPRVLFCSSITDLVDFIPGARYIEIGASEFNADSCKIILKQCATLAGGLWSIIVERSADGKLVRFGVLSYLATPTAIEINELIALVNFSKSKSFCVFIQKIDTKTISMMGSRGNTLRISFSTTKKTNSESREILQFAQRCTQKCSSEEFRTYFQKLVGDALGRSHGSILVCRDGLPITKVKGMADGVLIEPSIDLESSFETFKKFGTADSILEIQRYEQLLMGMMQSDGIVVFDTAGKITAYRVFFKDTSPAKKKPKKAPSIQGGARRRAFEGLKSLVGTELECALFRSQDGMMIYEGE
jgi:hypothetical protein